MVLWSNHPSSERGAVDFGLGFLMRNQIPFFLLIHPNCIRQDCGRSCAKFRNPWLGSCSAWHPQCPQAQPWCHFHVSPHYKSFLCPPRRKTSAAIRKLGSGAWIRPAFQHQPGQGRGWTMRMFPIRESAFHCQCRHSLIVCVATGRFAKFSSPDESCSWHYHKPPTLAAASWRGAQAGGNPCVFQGSGVHIPDPFSTYLVRNRLRRQVDKIKHPKAGISQDLVFSFH